VRDLPAYLGHFHPLWVHLPIGIFILLGTLEVAGLLRRIRVFSGMPALSPGLRSLILSIGAGVAVLAALLGWLLAHSGDYDPAVVRTHQWLGIASAAAALLLLAVHRVRWLYAPCLAGFLVLLTLAGHAGGKISHGNDYLTARMPLDLRRAFGVPVPVVRPPPTDTDHAIAYRDVIQPVLDERCTSCHGASKSNGGLRLDSWDALAKGGKDGPVLNLANLSASELLRRVDLPQEEKGHMPPLGKPQLADDDLTLLEWWMSAGASPDKAVAVLGAPALVGEILDTRIGGKAPERPPYRGATLVHSARIAAKLGILIRSMSPDGPWIDVNARPLGKEFGDAQLAQLAQIAPAIAWLDLGGTSVTDEGLGPVEAMHWLQRLHLDGTKISDKGLERLAHLRRIEYLNLRGTAVTDNGLLALHSMSRLRSIYVWQTAVTPEAVNALGEAVIDRRRIARWKADKEDLERRIEEEHFDGNTGGSLRLDAAQPTAAVPPK